MQNVVGPTLVAMATNFGLGTEIQSPTGLYLSISHFLYLFTGSVVFDIHGITAGNIQVMSVYLNSPLLNFSMLLERLNLTYSTVALAVPISNIASRVV